VGGIRRYQRSSYPAIFSYLSPRRAPVCCHLDPHNAKGLVLLSFLSTLDDRTLEPLGNCGVIDVSWVISFGAQGSLGTVIIMLFSFLTVSFVSLLAHLSAVFPFIPPLVRGFLLLHRPVRFVLLTNMLHLLVMRIYFC
jgi:hypothetical protein